jgi:hypothetical protein
MGNNRNETADQLARQDSSHLLTGPRPTFGVCAKITRGVIRNWTGRKHGEHWKYKDRLGAFLKNSSAEKAGNCSTEQKPAKNIERVGNRTLLFKTTPI